MADEDARPVPFSPLPPAEALADYERVVAGSADRMLKVFEQQAEHRMTMERLWHEAEIGRLRDDSRRASLGLGAGFVVALAVLGAAVYCASISQPWVAGVLGGLDIVALVGIFIYGTERRRSERLAASRISRDGGIGPSD